VIVRKTIFYYRLWYLREQAVCMHLSLAFNNLKQSQKNIILSKSYDMAKSEISLSSCMAARPQVTDIRDTIRILLAS
jgi:hypothetical protein